MEFIQNIDFTLVGLIICFIFEAIGKFFNNYELASTGRMKPEEINWAIGCFGIFYIVFIIILLWNPLLWLPALLIILVGLITGGVSRSSLQSIKDLLDRGYKVDNITVKSHRNIARIYFIIDKVITLGLLGWMIFLHLTDLGIIA